MKLSDRGSTSTDSAPAIDKLAPPLPGGTATAPLRRAWHFRVTGTESSDSGC